MQDQNAILDVFSFSTEDLNANTNVSQTNIYSPDPRKGKAGVYDAIVRFLPWYKNSKDSILKKSFFWLEDPNTKQGFYVDCPTNIGEKSILWDTFWKFKNSESVTEKAKADKFKRKENYYSLVQIVKDENRPELNGKIMIFKYGFKIHSMLESAMKPKFGNLINPFDLFNAPLFGLSVKIAHGWNNYDDCKFIESTTGPIFINGVKMEQTDAHKKQILDYLQTSPDLVDVAKHQPLSAENTTKMNEILRFYLNTQNTVQSQPVNTINNYTVQPQTSITQPQQATNIVVENTQPISEPINSTQVSQPIVENNNTQAPSSDDDALASLYANL